MYLWKVKNDKVTLMKEFYHHKLRCLVNSFLSYFIHYLAEAVVRIETISAYQLNSVHQKIKAVPEFYPPNTASAIPLLISSLALLVH